MKRMLEVVAPKHNCAILTLVRLLPNKWVARGFEGSIFDSKHERREGDKIHLYKYW